MASLAARFMLQTRSRVCHISRRRLAMKTYSRQRPSQQWRQHSTSFTNDDSSMWNVLQSQVNTGELRSDKAQERVAKRLSRLQVALVGYDNSILFELPKRTKEVDSDPGPGVEKEELAGNQREKTEKDEIPKQPITRIPRGLYIHGTVGTGKSMLMDTFFDNAPVQKKSRYHFHSFLAEVHRRIYELKQRDLQTKGRSFSIDTSLENNPITRVGLQLSSQLSLLCLDEFQVTDIADAVILSQLFGVLFRKGTVVVATSNRPPQDLYEGGLNRGYFLPFIDLLEKHCIVHPIKSNVDYRRLESSCSSFFVTPKELDRLTNDLLVQGLQDETPPKAHTMELDVGFQRTLTVQRAYGERIGCFLFDELCDKDLGSSDYRAIAQRFDIVVLEDIPTLDLEGHNRARRFITLIDELYEGKCALLCSSLDEAPTPMDLFQSNFQQQKVDGVQDLEDVMGIDVASQGGTAVGALASVRELAFAFDRAASRMFEMCSRSWWDRVLE